jgi:quercetin dioxygenase-like cupin family protein
MTDQATETTDAVPTSTGVVFRPANSGPATWAMGSLFERLINDAESGEQFGASIVTQPPGIATPLHTHSHEAEAFYLLDGTMTYRAGDEIYHLGTGDFIYLPLGLPHAFRITGRTPAKLLALTVPGRLLGLYDKVGMPAGERRLPGEDGRSMPEEIGRWNEFGSEYGLQVVGPPIPEDA